MVFRKGGRLSNNISFSYNNEEKEIITKFRYLDVVLVQVDLLQKPKIL